MISPFSFVSGEFGEAAGDFLAGDLLVGVFFFGIFVNYDTKIK